MNMFSQNDHHEGSEVDGMTTHLHDAESRINHLLENGNKLRLQRKYTQGRKLVEQALALALRSKFPLKAIDAHILLGLYDFDQEKLDDSIGRFQKVLQIAENQKHSPSIYRILTNLGVAYNNLGKPDDAWTFLQRALDIAREMNLPEKIAKAENNLGDTHIRRGEYTEALKLISQAMHRFREMGDHIHVAYCMTNIGEIFFKQKQYLEANRTLQEALDIARQQTDLSLQVNILMIQGRVHRQLGYDGKAVDAFLEGLSIADQNNLKYSARILVKELTDLYYQRQEFKSAFEYLQRLAMLEDLIYNEESRLQVDELRLRYELKLKERETEIYRFRTQKLQQSITETEKAYQELKDTQNKILSQEKRNTRLHMAVTANHELNQPLMILKGSTELIHFRFGDQMDTNVKSLLRDIDRNIDKIDGILTRFRHREADLDIEDELM